MLSFLFWNIGKRPLTEYVARLAAFHQVDVLMLAECEIDPIQLKTALNDTESGFYSYPFSASDKISIFTRLPETSLIEQADDNLRRVTIRRLKLGKDSDILLVVAHLQSKLFWSESDQAAEVQKLVREIDKYEDKLGHRRTLLVGDFNMNSFDDGVVAAHCLHAIMSLTQARREIREIEGAAYRFFYNPMWGCFGDRTPGPPGSYYLRASKPVHFFWNMYDQVLLRPSLMNSLEELRILDSDGTESLLSKGGLPSVSDHLPILFRLSL